MVVAVLAAYALAESNGGWEVDAALALVFGAAVLTLESGVLVWVVAAAAWATGAGGYTCGVTVCREPVETRPMRRGP